jgi:hypothetical protein
LPNLHLLSILRGDSANQLEILHCKSIYFVHIVG